MRPEHDGGAIVWEAMALPRDKRQTEDQAGAVTRKAIEQHEFHCSGDAAPANHGMAAASHW